MKIPEMKNISPSYVSPQECDDYLKTAVKEQSLRIRMGCWDYTLHGKMHFMEETSSATFVSTRAPTRKKWKKSRGERKHIRRMKGVAR